MVKQLIGKNDIHLKARKNKTLSINSLFVVQLERWTAPAIECDLLLNYFVTNPLN